MSTVESLSEIKKELKTRSQAELMELLVRISRYRKENKELLSYLLFESHDKFSFIEKVKAEMNEQFDMIGNFQVYYLKKSLRKILRFAQKNIKYSGDKEVEMEVLIHFCQRFQSLQIKGTHNQVLLNIYDRQLIKLHKTLSTLHEDLQYDYQLQMQSL
ncbi:MAG: hypothetical protein ACOYLH_10305 [Flavobacteriales bacterium]